MVTDISYLMLKLWTVNYRYVINNNKKYHQRIKSCMSSKDFDGHAIVTWIVEFKKKDYCSDALFNKFWAPQDSMAIKIFWWHARLFFITSSFSLSILRNSSWYCSCLISVDRARAHGFCGSCVFCTVFCVFCTVSWVFWVCCGSNSCDSCDSCDESYLGQNEND